MAVKDVFLAQPRGFCAGVEMAVDTVERALQKFGAPVYVFHEIVHNRSVVEDFQRRGVIFVQSVEEVPTGATLIFSAHGISPAVNGEAKAKELQLILDATCPLVEKVHREVRRYNTQSYWIFLIGQRGHDEIVGTSGEAPKRIQIVSTVEEAHRVDVPDPKRVAVLTQTTLSIDDTREIIEALKKRFPNMIVPAKDDICYATQNRQDAVKELAGQVELILVIGSPNSENSNQLCRVANSKGTRAYLINSINELDPNWLEGVERLGITSGASAPEHLVQEAAGYFKQRGAHVTSIGFKEQEIHFALPDGLEASS